MREVLLSELREGQVITAEAGEGDDQYVYEFTVERSGKLPICALVQTSPRGEQLGPHSVELLGSGRMTTEAQNPMQRADWFVGRPRQEVALSIGWGLLFIGGCAVVRDPHERENNFYKLEPELTDIKLGKPLID